MAEVDDIIAAARLREETTTICVAGDLNGEYEQLDAELSRLTDEGWNPGKLSDVDPRRDIAERMDALRGEMRAHEYTFRFRALPWRRYQQLKDVNSLEDGKGWDVSRFAPALVAACGIDPVFRDVPHVEALFERLTQQQVDDLFTAAWRANEGRADIPKSARASALMAASAPKPSAPDSTV